MTITGYTAERQYLQDVRWYRNIHSGTDEHDDFVVHHPQRYEHRRDVEKPVYNSKKRPSFEQFIKSTIQKRIDASHVLRKKLQAKGLTFFDLDIQFNVPRFQRSYGFDECTYFSDFFYFSRNKIVQNWEENVKIALRSPLFRQGKIRFFRMIHRAIFAPDRVKACLQLYFDLASHREDYTLILYALEYAMKRYIPHTERKRGFEDYLAHVRSAKKKDSLGVFRHVLTAI